MKVIGLAGKSGCGKSAVACELAAQRNVEWIDLDRLAWDVYRPGTKAFSKLVNRFGPAVVSADGGIDRSRLAESAFEHPKALQDLEVIVHPAVLCLLNERIDDARCRSVAVLLVEGAVLIHSPHVDRSIFDAIVWLDASPATRAERLRTAGRADHTDRVPDPSPEALTGVERISAEGTVAEVAERLRALIHRA